MKPILVALLALTAITTANAATLAQDGWACRNYSDLQRLKNLSGAPALRFAKVHCVRLNAREQTQKVNLSKSQVVTHRDKRVWTDSRNVRRSYVHTRYKAPSYTRSWVSTSKSYSGNSYNRSWVR